MGVWLPQGCWRSRYCGGGPPVNCTEFSDVGDILRSSKLRMCALLRVTARADAYAGCSPCKSSICVLQPISLLQQRRVNLSDASDARQTMIREPPLPYLCFLQLGVAGWLAASGQTWPLLCTPPHVPLFGSTKCWLHFDNRCFSL